MPAKTTINFGAILNNGSQGYLPAFSALLKGLNTVEDQLALVTHQSSQEQARLAERLAQLETQVTDILRRLDDLAYLISEDLLLSLSAPARPTPPAPLTAAPTACANPLPPTPAAAVERVSLS